MMFQATETLADICRVMFRATDSVSEYFLDFFFISSSDEGVGRRKIYPTYVG